MQLASTRVLAVSLVMTGCTSLTIPDGVGEGDAAPVSADHRDAAVRDASRTDSAVNASHQGDSAVTTACMNDCDAEEASDCSASGARRCVADEHGCLHWEAQGSCDDASTGTAITVPDASSKPDASVLPDASASAPIDAGSTPPVPTPDAAAPAGFDEAVLAQHCVDTVNGYRTSAGLLPLTRDSAQEACIDGEVAMDAAKNQQYSAFGSCRESAQNECPGWSTTDAVSQLDTCLAQQWAEGPGDFNAGHGHYNNLANTTYTKVACGFHDLGNGKFWAAINLR